MTLHWATELRYLARARSRVALTAYLEALSYLDYPPATWLQLQTAVLRRLARLP
jgi:hypothetical protein